MRQAGRGCVRKKEQKCEKKKNEAKRKESEHFGTAPRDFHRRRYFMRSLITYTCTIFQLNKKYRALLEKLTAQESTHMCK